MNEDIEKLEARARTLMREKLGASWKFQWGNAKRTYGVCMHRRRVIRISALLASMNSAEETWNTITHEIAHAMAGEKEAHGERWRKIHIELGGDGSRCYDRKKVSIPKLAYAAFCSCTPGEVIGERQKRPIPGRTYRHKTCGNTVEWKKQ